MQTKKVEPYGFAESFEKAVVLLACSRTRFYGRVGHSLFPEALGERDTPARLAIETAHEIAKEVGHGPDSPLLVLQRLARRLREGKVTKSAVEAVALYFEDAEDVGIPPEDSVIAELVPVLQRRIHQNAVEAAMSDYAKRGDMMQVVEMVQSASRLGQVDTSIGLWLGGDSFAEIERVRHLQRLPTGVLELDAGLHGGLPRAQMGVAVGGAGDGKSMFLSHMGARSSAEGLFIGYVTLELPRATILGRVLANLTGVPIDTILETDAGMDKARHLVERMKLGPMAIQEMTAKATTVADIAAWVQTAEDEKKRKMDLLLVDYADKLTAHIPGRDQSNDYKIMGRVYESLRVFGVERNMWLWTASQAKSGAGKKKDCKRIDLEHASDSIEKARVADIVLTLNADHEEQSVMNYFVAKNRTGKSRFMIGPVPIDFSCGAMGPVAYETAVALPRQRTQGGLF